jgi:hypothetical protein
MEEALSFARALEVWIYLLIGLGGLIYIRKFVLAWQELRGAAFGLERESAQARLNQSASMLVLLLTMTVTEFVLVSFVVPAVPGAAPLPTATLDMLATPSITLPATTQQNNSGQATGVPVFQGITPGSGCLPGQIEISIPKNGEEVKGVVPLIGTADIANFGFYKFEIKRPDETVWLTIQAGNEPIQNNKLGDWDTSRLSPGEYQLALVIVDNQAKASPPCIIQLRVASPPQTTASP